MRASRKDRCGLVPVSVPWTIAVDDGSARTGSLPVRIGYSGYRWQATI